MKKMLDTTVNFSPHTTLVTDELLGAATAKNAIAALPAFASG